MIQDYVIASALREDDRAVLLALHEKHLDKPHWDAVVFIRDYLGMHRTLPTKTAVEAFMKKPLQETSDPAAHWLREVQANFKKRLTEEAVMTAAKNPAQALAVMQKAVLEAQLANETARIRAFDEGANERYKEYHKNKGLSVIRYLSTMFPDMDAVTYGYWPSDFWIFGSPEGMGKTWLLTKMAVLLDIFLSAQDPDGPPILLINTEVDDDEIMERMDAQRYALPYGQLLSGTLDKIAEKRWATGTRSLKSRLRVIDDCENLDDLDRYIQLTRPCIVFADSVHLLVPDYEWQDIAKLGQRLKRMAKKHRCPIVGNTHLKGGEGRDGAGTTDSFAYGKGFTRNASVAALLYQDEQMELMGELGVKFVKVRRGKKETLIYTHDWSTMDYRFEGLLGRPGTVSTEADDAATPLW